MSITPPTSLSSTESAARTGLQLLERTVLRNRYIPLKPTPHQSIFLTLPHREVGYGGAAGGGKSFAELMAALQYVHHPQYAALMLRRTYKDLSLPGALMDIAEQWLRPTDAKWEADTKTWRFPSGATLTFGYLSSERDKYQYQGARFHYVAFDELTQFTESMYRYLFSRCRKENDDPIPLRVRSGFNPGGLGHIWVKQRFRLGKGADPRPPGRAFVPAKMGDNPYLNHKAYREMLGELDPITRAQLQHWDWDIRPEGNLFKRAWFTIVQGAPKNLIKTVRFWDFAGTAEEEGGDPDWTAGVKIGVDPFGLLWILNAKRIRGTPLDVRKLVMETAARDGRNVPVYIEQEPGSAGKHVIDAYRREYLPGYEVRGVRSTGDKVSRAGSLSAMSEAGDVRIVAGAWVDEFLDELCAFPEVDHDDQVDAASGAQLALAGKADDIDRAAWGKAMDDA